VLLLARGFTAGKESCSGQWIKVIEDKVGNIRIGDNVAVLDLFTEPYKVCDACTQALRFI